MKHSTKRFTLSRRGPFAAFTMLHANKFTGTSALHTPNEQITFSWYAGNPVILDPYANGSYTIAHPPTWPILEWFRAGEGECFITARPIQATGAVPAWTFLRMGYVSRYGHRRIVDSINDRRASEIEYLAPSYSSTLGEIPEIAATIELIKDKRSLNRLLNEARDPFLLAVDLGLLETIHLINLKLPENSTPTTKVAPDALAELEMVYCLLDRRRWTAAAKVLRCIDRELPGTKALLAWCAFLSEPTNSELKDLARAGLTAAVDQWPGNPRLLYYLAMLSKLDGNVDKAESLLLRAAKLTPGDKTIQKDLAVLQLRKRVTRRAARFKTFSGTPRYVQ